MRSLLTVFALIVMFAATAYANPYSCEKHSLELSNGTLVEGNARSSIEDQKSLIERLQTALPFTWRASREPVEIVKAIDLSTLRNDRDLEDHALNLSDALGELLAPGMPSWKLNGTEKEHIDRFPLLRRMLASPAVLGALYTVAKPVLKNRFVEEAVVGAVAEIIEQHQHLFAKEYNPVVARGAADWSYYGCWSPVDKLGKEAQRKCPRVAWFPAKYKEHYGLEAEQNSAFVLGALHRRYREGGKPLVAKWQEIIRDYAGD